MSEAGKALGKWGEDLACAHLLDLGYRILARNVRLPMGEIDCVARHGRELYLIEVKTRRGSSHGTAAEQLHPQKLRRMHMAALCYLARNPHPGFFPHISLLAIDVGPTGPQIHFIPDVIT